MSEISFNDPQQTTWLDRPLAAILQLDWEKALYLTFLLLAIVSRFYGLGARVVSHDESLHTQYSYQYYIGDGYSHTPLMHGPFLFHITAASFWLFGDSDLTSRIPVAIFGILLVLMPYFLRHWLGRTAALFASFFLLISPYILYYSRYIRHDIYIIIWALIVFIATLYYQREQRKQYLWWFAGGLAMMFATKEVAFIYVAIFGSFLVLRSLAKMTQFKWSKSDFNRLRRPIAVIVLGAVMLVGSFLAVRSLESVPLTDEVKATEPISADPNQATAESNAIDSDTTNPSLFKFAKMGQAIGLAIAGIGVFLAVSALRPRLKQLPEFDLIILYAALILPTTTALFAVLAGINPRDFNLRSCGVVSSAETSPLSLALQKIASFTCWQSFFTSPIVISSSIMLVLLFAGLALGYWWFGRRFFTLAAIFHILFGLFYTSLFTNNAGWYSGMVDSLGYWIEQQEVARGGQPAFYYLFVTPFYEFLPILFSLLAIRLWLRRHKLSRTVGYWVSVLLVTYLGYSFSNWLVNRPIGGTGFDTSTNGIILIFVLAASGLQLYRQTRAQQDRGIAKLANAVTLMALLAILAGIANLPINGMIIDPATGVEVLRESSKLVGLLVAVLIFLSSSIYFMVVRREQIARLENGLRWRERFDPMQLTGFIPALIWWMVLTWLAYSYAGEKMPWLSTHIVIPTVMLAGWYLGEKVKELSAESGPILTQTRLLRVAAATVLLLVGFLTLKPILVDIDFGAQTLSNLRNVGLLFGRLATLLLLIYLWQKWVGNISAATRQRTFIFATFILLSILTIRFSYMANYVNYDQPNEFLVYAHGNPATKQQVMPQLDELAMRLEGDKTIRVSFDNKSSWPYYWYLRDYPNQHFFGETPDASIKDSPVILAGSDKWDAVENILRDEYEATTLGYIWWPMEEYRKFSWSALFGINADPAAERGLGSRPVREAFWDIFFQRDFTKYGELFGGTYDNGKWPLRADLKMYIRRDVLAKLWDSGVVAAAYQPPVDLYAEGEIEISAELSIGSQGSGDGQLNRPRNVAVSADGHIYVADTGNHRIQVFAPDGTFAFGFGEPTPADTTPLPGQFNEPWGITIDDEFVYVADTWNGRIQKFTLSGEFVDAFGTFAIPADGSEGALEFYGPRSVALFDGKLFITDTGNHRLQVLDTDGNYVGQVGSPGFALGEFNEPVSLALDSNGTIYVAEAWARRIQALSNDLTPLSEWEIDAWDGNSLDNKPYLTTDSNNRIYATDPEGSRVLMFNTIGEYLGKFGRFGTDLSQFDLPTGITTDSNNNLYIADTNNNRILKFAPIDLTQ